jgi:hypothetical protein
MKKADSSGKQRPRNDTSESFESPVRGSVGHFYNLLPLIVEGDTQMLFLAKAALGLGASVALAGVYVFHEGVIRVDVDENRIQGSHVHVWVPATVVPVGLSVVPNQKLREAAAQASPYLPALREVSKELKKYPDAELVNVRDATDHVHIAVHRGKLYIDAVSETDNIHVSVPVETISDVANRLEEAAPAI